MKRILFVNTQGKMGGAERSLAGLVKFLGHEFCLGVVCPLDGGLAEELRKIGVQVFDLHFASNGKKGLMEFVRIAISNVDVFFSAVQFRAGVVHANGVRGVLSCVLWRVVLGRKLIWHVRDVPRRGLAVMLAKYICDLAIAVSGFIEEELISVGVKAGKIRIIYNGIENGAVCKKNAGNGVVTFAAVGQVVPWKKVELFIEAAEIAGRMRDNARFLVVGDDIFGNDARYRDGIAAKIAESDYRDRMRWVRWQADAGEVWAGIDVLVHAADREPFGRVALEAGVHGAAVIAVDGGGPGEILTEGVSALLVEADSAGRIAEAMVRLMDEGELRERLSRGAYEVSRRYGIELTAEKVAMIYRGL